MPRQTQAAAAQAAKPLNLRQQRFVHEYLVDEMAAAAARRAGYSVKSSLHSGHQLMKHPRVLAAIAAEKAARAAPLTREQAIEGLRQIAEANVLDYARPGPDGALELDLWRLSRDRAGAVKALTVVEKTDPRTGVVTRTVRFELADRAAALKMLAPMLTSTVAAKGRDMGFGDGVESILELEVGQFERLKAFWEEQEQEAGYRRLRKGVELSRRLQEFWIGERGLDRVADWEPTSAEDCHMMDAEMTALEIRAERSSRGQGGGR